MFSGFISKHLDARDLRVPVCFADRVRLAVVPGWRSALATRISFFQKSARGFESGQNKARITNHESHNLENLQKAP
jgi:hypothetical protein